MKKLICGLVCLFIAMTMFGAYAEDGFTVHGGLRFGMTEEEVVAFEKGKGIEVVSINDDSNSIDVSDEVTYWIYHGIGDMVGMGDFAGEDAYLYFSFNDHQLVSIVVLKKNGGSDFTDSCIKTFQEKYGDPISSGSQYVKLPYEGHNIFDVINNTEYQKDYNEKPIYNYDWTTNSHLRAENYHQYMTSDNENYVNIEIVNAKYDWYKGKTKTVQLTISNTLISYSLVPGEAMQEQIDSINDAKAKRDNDL
ncbi:MAG: hypothetical protein IJI26_11265 [Clostridia bacterium]|nr:hypothetical protein [Clostridia bacterium]